VIAAIRIQDARSPLTAQDLHGADIHPSRRQVAADGWDLGVLAQQAHHVVGRPVIEVINIDLGSFTSLLLPRRPGDDASAVPA